MPVSALPSRTGVGELGAYAYEFVDALKENGVKIWQILPLNPVGYGNSPYQPYSSCAGDELYISQWSSGSSYRDSERIRVKAVLRHLSGKIQQ